MTVQQAIKKYKLEPLSVSVAKVKAKELNVDEVLYMNVQKNKYAYIVRDSRGIMLYSDERNLYTKLYKGLKITPLEYGKKLLLHSPMESRAFSHILY